MMRNVVAVPAICNVPIVSSNPRHHSSTRVATTEISVPAPPLIIHHLIPIPLALRTGVSLP